VSLVIGVLLSKNESINKKQLKHGKIVDLDSHDLNLIGTFLGKNTQTASF
jgi:hypothetical protein